MAVEQGQTLEQLAAAGWSATPNTAPTAVDMLSRRKATSDAPEEPSRLNDLISMLQTAAHPQTLDDIGHLLMADVDATRGLGTKAISMMLDKLAAVRSSLSKPADAIVGAAVKRLGFDSDAMDLAATKMRLQAARSTTRQGRLTSEIAKIEQAANVPRGTPATAAPAPVSASPAPAAATPGSMAEFAPADTPVAAPAKAASAPVAPAFTSKEEQRYFQQLIDRGMARDVAEKAVVNARALAARLKTPALADIETTFPKGMRGKS